MSEQRFPTPRLRKIAKVGLQGLVLILALSVALEMILRGVDIATGAVITDSIIASIYTSHSQPHPFLEYTSRKNFVGRVPFVEPGKTFTLATNSHGFRSHEFYPKLPGHVRVLLLGDSFVFGMNANQDETIASQLELLLKTGISKNIDVLSLGVVSYSGLRYAMLSKLYFDFLNPDFVVVSLDASDFEEDVTRLPDYQLDARGEPVALKDASDLIERENQGVTQRVVLDSHGVLHRLPPEEWLPRIQAGSSLLRRLFSWAESAQDSARKRQGEARARTTWTIKRPDSSSDLRLSLPPGLAADTVPVPLEQAILRYQPTLTSLRMVKRACERIDAKLYLATYPYPWMVSVRSSIPYQLHFEGVVYDLRDNRTHPRLVNHFARQLAVPHLDAYPLFEGEIPKSYGDFDPHFNAFGYRRYARFLFDAIAPDVSQRVQNLRDGAE